MKDRLMKNMGYFIVLLDMFIYFVLSYVRVDGLEQNLFAVFVNGFLLFISSVIATSSMTKQGLLNGGDSQKYQETVRKFISENEKISSKTKYLQAWLDKDYFKLLRIGRTAYVNSAGYEYEEIFNQDGKVKDGFNIEKPNLCGKHKIKDFLFSEKWKRYREQKRLIKLAKKYKITRLTVTDITTIDVPKDPNNYGPTEKEYEAKTGGTNLITKTIFSIFLPTIAWAYLGFNLQTFITQIINIILILITALWSMYSAYNFKVRTHRAGIIKKINKMEEFYNSDIEEFKNEICSQESIPTKSNMVEEIHRSIEPNQENNLCCDQ